MTKFESIHQDEILGSLSTFDRLNFKGHLMSFFPRGAMARYLYMEDVLLKEFKDYAQRTSGEIKEHVLNWTSSSGRPYEYLAGASTVSSGCSKEERARGIAERDGVKEGLVCTFGAVENCYSYRVCSNGKKILEFVRSPRKCMHYYAYFIDKTFGWMHVRLQSWFPFSIQICINGREWLSRELDKRGIGYERYNNCFLQIDDMKMAQEICDKFARRSWVREFDHFAKLLNPLTAKIKRRGFGSYYWVADQAEYATDIMFRDRETLEQLMPDLFQHSTLCFSAEDVMHFLGRRLHGNFKGEVTIDRKKRPEGSRIKYRMKRNSLKMYDKWSVLRVETTINNPREFKVLRILKTDNGQKRRWVPMGKGVANLWRYAQVGGQSNARYLEALAQADLKGEVVRELDELCLSQTVNGRRFAKFNPVSAKDVRLFEAVMAGEHNIRGFRNRDLALRLHSGLLDSPEKDRKRHCAGISRWIAKLRGHGLVAKVKDARLYRITKRGYRIMASVLLFRGRDFPAAYQQAQ
jgi:hypothetical protein